MSEPPKASRLTPLKFHSWRKFPSGGRQANWECECRCGKIVVRMLSLVKSGHVKSCGCLAAEHKLANRFVNKKLINSSKKL